MPQDLVLFVVQGRKDIVLKSVEGFIILTMFTAYITYLFVGLYTIYGNWRELRHARKQQDLLK
jgi:hypothetical protein